jgi:hypothetical protein
MVRTDAGSPVRRMKRMKRIFSVDRSTTQNKNCQQMPFRLLFGTNASRAPK